MSKIRSMYYSQSEDPNYSTSQFLILNLGDVHLDVDVDPVLFRFKINQYSAICRDSSMEQIVGPANNFFSTLEITDQTKMVLTLLHANLILQSIDDTSMQQYQEALDNIKDILTSLDKDINLFSKMSNFVSEYVPIDDMSSNGTAPTHTAAMTFFQHEVHLLTTVCLLCKLLFPLFGEILHKGKTLSVIGFKEIDCAGILTNILNNNCSQLVLKLNYYISSLVGKKIQSGMNDCIATWHGINQETTTPKMKASIFIKKFATENMYNGNVTKYITTGARSGTSSQYENAKTKMDVQYRGDPSENAQEDGNTSIMESESKPSKHGADFPIILKHQTNSIWEDYVNKYQLDKNIIKEAQHYYLINPIASTGVSLYLLTNYFGGNFGGGRSIRHIKMDTYILLAATMQLIMLKMDSVQLLHALTMCPTNQLRVKTTEVDNSLSYTWTSSSAYRLCKQTFPPGFGEVSWDNKVKELVTELTTTTYVYNTAPIFWDMINTPPMNNTVIPDHYKMIEDLLKLLHIVYTKEDI